jgi:hypothetical protein
MYQAIQHAGGKINAFGLDLSQNALAHHSSVIAAIPFYVLLLVMIGTQYLQSAQMMSRNPAAQDNPQMKMMKYLPVVFGVICIRFPAGVILYYAVSNICRMAQQTAMYRFDPKVKALVAQEVIEVESTTRRMDKADSAKTPAAPRSRFRDALAKAAEQQAKTRADKEKAGGGAPPGRSGQGSRSAKAGSAKAGTPKPAGTSKATGGNKAGSTSKNGANARAGGAARAAAAAKPRPAKAADPTKAEPTKAVNPAKRTNTKARPPETKQVAGPPTNGAVADKQAGPPPETPPAAAPSNQSPSTNGNGNGNGNGSNGNGNGSGSTDATPARTGGRTGAQAPRSTKKRRGR